MGTKRTKAPTAARRRLAAVSRAIPLAAGLLPGGCAFDSGPEVLHSFRRPADGAALTEAFGEQVADPEEKVGLRGRYFLLPMWISADMTTVGPGGDAVTQSSFSAFNPGLTSLPLLPLWWSNESRMSRRTGEGATSSLLWTPFFATSTDAGWPADVPTARARGIPLLYGRVEYGAEGAAPWIDVHATLWTLGPAWIRIAFDVDTGYEEGWAFMPLALAGLGSLLWTSSERASDTSEESVHGPLVGYLGYLGYRAKVDRAERTRSLLLLAGILWYDAVDSDAEGVTTDARHGPLWGLFGWGHSDGRAAIRLFGYPIAVE
jgi:hypothetical protein